MTTDIRTDGAPAGASDIDMAEVEAFVHQVIGDAGATVAGVLTYIGDRLGLYRAMAGAGPLTAEELAARTGTHLRYVREWLADQAAGGYVRYVPGDAGSDERFLLPAAHAAVLADESSPAFVAPVFEMAASAWADADLAADAVRTGAGVAWGEHDRRLYPATERFFRTGYQTYLISSWIPALDGVEEKLRAGASCADVGCGHGATTVMMAQAYPASSFAGFDVHDASVDAARESAAAAGVSERVGFDVATAAEIPPRSGGYDLICFFDCLHDMGDPVAAMRRAGEVLAEDGTVLVVEPLAGNRLADNLHPLGRLMYAASTLFCVPHAIAEGGESSPSGRTLGGQAGEERLAAVMHEAGFGRIRMVAQTPTNMVLEVRR